MSLESEASMALVQIDESGVEMEAASPSSTLCAEQVQARVPISASEHAEISGRTFGMDIPLESSN